MPIFTILSLREYYGGYDDVYAGTHGIQGARDPVFIGINIQYLIIYSGRLLY